MIYTREQFDLLGDFVTDDFPISGDSDYMFKLFNKLPGDIQAKAFLFGVNDTEVRDEIFVYLCRLIFNMSTEEYYESEYASEYFNDGILINDKVADLLDFDDSVKVEKDIVIQGAIVDGIAQVGSIKTVLSNNEMYVDGILTDSLQSRFKIVVRNAGMDTEVDFENMDDISTFNNSGNLIERESQ